MDLKQKIIASVFTKRNPPETYISHVKIWEDTEDDTRKPRYILLSRNSNDEGFIHKSKMNTNGTFSIGKTWRLNELRGIEVIDANNFIITLTRSYRWQTEDANQQSEFVTLVVRTLQALFPHHPPLSLVNMPVRTNNNISRQPRISIEQPPRAVTPSRSVPSTGRDSPKFVPQLPISPARPLSPPIRPSYGRPDSLNSAVSAPSIYTRSPAPPNETPRVSKSPSRPSSRPPSRPSTATPTDRERNSQPSLFESGRISGLSDRQLDPGGYRVRRSPSPGDGGAPRTPPPPPPLHLPAVSPLQLRKMRSATEKIANGLDPSTETRPAIPQQPRQPSPIPPSSQQQQQQSRQPSPIPPPPQQPPQSPPQPRVPPSPQPEAVRDFSQPVQTTTTVRKEMITRDPNARISFFDSANQSTLDRLLAPSSSTGIEEDSLEVIMANVEEMLEGYEWVNDTESLTGTKRKRTAADQVEARLQDELVALEKATIYAFLEDDDRIDRVLKYIDDSLREIDGMETMVSSYKIHLNAVSEDISYIQSQNRGLQVQTQNQKALLQELQNLLETVNVNPSTLLVLTQESLEKQSGIEALERAAAELYKALLSSRDSDMAMTVGRLEEYRTYNNQFCKRLFDYLSIVFSFQSDRTLNNKARNPNELRRHTELEEYLGRYCGLMLYLKEMSEDWYSKVCAAYFSSASSLHNQEIKACLSFYASQVKKATEEEQETGFNPTPVARGTEQLRRVRSIRTPSENRLKDRDKRTSELRSPEALEIVLKQIGPQVFHEEQFIADFLHINDSTLSYAVYVNLDTFFIRQASRTINLSSNTVKLVRGAMDLIFGFLAGELKTWIDIALIKDNIQVVGVLVTLENAIKDGEQRGNLFWARLLQRQQQRLKGVYDRHIDEQVRAIEQTKLTTKKRKGVAQFIKYFPTYVGRIESQLTGGDNSETRLLVDTAYERIVQSMFEALKQMAKLIEGDGDGEDKDQLNYHVELVENMQYFMTEMNQLEIGNFRRFFQMAQSIYDENVSAYVKIILRRPFARLLDYFDAVERLLQSSPPTDIVNKPNYGKNALKRVIKEYNAKDVRRHIDALYKRVEKHYTDEDLPNNTSVLLKDVWTACEQELVKSTERFNRIIAQCYKDANVPLEYTSQDIEAAFRKHRLNGQT